MGMIICWTWVFSVIDQLQSNRQTAIKSATWPKIIRYLAINDLRRALQVTVSSLNLALVKSVTQRMRMVKKAKKLR